MQLIILYPTLSFEPFGLVPVEAQASGVPALFYNAGGLPETLINNVTGFVVEAGDYRALGMKIYELVQNPANHGQIARQARSSVLSEILTRSELTLFEEITVDAILKNREIRNPRCSHCRPQCRIN